MTGAITGGIFGLTLVYLACATIALDLSLFAWACWLRIAFVIVALVFGVFGAMIGGAMQFSHRHFRD